MRRCSSPQQRRPSVPKALCVAILAAWLGQPAWAQTPVATPEIAAMDHDQLLSQARQQRDAQQWEASLAAFRQGRTRFPKDPAFQYGEIYVLADSGQADQAASQALDLLRQQPNNPDALLLMGYAQLRQNGSYAALEYVDRALQLAPERGYVVREYIDALQRAGMATQALALAQRHPDLLTPAQMRALQADEVADTVRFTSTASRSEAERFVLADQALARYEALFAAWRPLGAETAELIQRARIDRLQALHARSYMSELVREYEDLRSSGAEIPPYALEDVGSAYLYLREPEKSAEIYESLAAMGYMRNDDRTRQSQDVGLLYTYSDRGDVATAQRMAHEMAENYPRWRYVEGEKVNVPNDAYLEAHQNAAVMDLYANQTDSAQAQLQTMSEAAPWNLGLHTDLAFAYRLRGWPRLAEQELKIAETLQPRALSVETAQGSNALTLQEWRQAELLNADVMERFPESNRSKRLNRQWDVHNMAELQISAYRGLSNGGSSGGNPIAGSRDFGLESTIYSAPMDYNWRLFAGAGHRTGTFPEGDAQQNFGRFGLEWRSRDWHAEGEISSSTYGFGDKIGARLASTYDINDYWQLSAAANWRSRATPLRALYHGVTSNSLELGLRWRASEMREWSVSFTPSRFSDGNNRQELSIGGKERLITRPTWTLDLGLDAYASHNSLTNVTYYSPRNEFSLMPSLQWNHTIYQRYEKQWTQQASIGLGGVHQQGFSTGNAQFISYGQRYRHSDQLEFGATVSGLRRPYDGVHEREWRLIFDMTYRF